MLDNKTIDGLYALRLPAMAAGRNAATPAGCTETPDWVYGFAGIVTTPEEIKTLLATPEVDHSGLVRVELQAKVAQQRSCPPSGFLGLVP